MSDSFSISEKYSATIKDYCIAITNIWPQDILKSPVYFWHYIVKHASQACENVRKNEWHEVAWSLSEIVVWWLSYLNKVTKQPIDDKIDNIITYIDCEPDDIIWYKYPYVCPNCLGRLLFKNNLYNENPNEIVVNRKRVKKILEKFNTDIQCTCLSDKRFIEERDENFKKFVLKNVNVYAINNYDKKPITMFKMVEMLQDIFNNNTDVLTIEEISFHLLEEVGEVSTALTDLFMMDTKYQSSDKFKNERKNKVKIFADELADVFSWSVSLLMKINNYLACTALFVKTFYEKDTLTINFIESITKSTKNLVDLIWLVFKNDKNILACEKCRQFPCNERHERHEGKRGFLYDDMLIDANYVKLIIENSKIINYYKVKS